MPPELREAPVHEIAPAEIEPLESATVQYEELFLQVPPASADADEAAPESGDAPDDAAAAPEPEGTTWSFSSTARAPNRSSPSFRSTRSPP